MGTSTYTIQQKKQDITPLAVYYSILPTKSSFGVNGNGLSPTVNYIYPYEYHRYATRVYEYVGLSESDAQTKAQELVAAYTRKFRYSTVRPNSLALMFDDVDGGNKLQTTVQTINTSGCMWTVRVSVNEDDVLLRTTRTENPTTVFYEENNREYDY